MKLHLYLSVVLILLAGVLGMVLVDTMTGAAVQEDDPCGIVDCRVRMFGFWQTKAERVGTTPDGLAVCHCPHEPEYVNYYVSTHRKY